MESAKEAVKGFIRRSGHHDTEVDEHVKPAVTEEHVKPHRHEEETKAVDREVHQDHYHTTVQPLQHKEVLPERHTHQQLPVEEREFRHGDSDRVRQGVETEAAKFASTSTTHPTTHSTAAAPAVSGEHVHHHVHETVQPVIHKDTIQPEVVHTTRPIHETHHAQAEHHGMSVLPTKTLDEFKSLGGKAVGESHRHEEYEGHPRPYNPAMQAGQSGADVNPAAHDGLHPPHDTQPSLTGSTGRSHHSGTGVGTTGASGLGGSTSSTGALGGTGTTGTTGGLSGTSGHNVSGIGSTHPLGTDYTSGGGATSTGTALGGRTEDNTAGRALDTATSHSSGVGNTHSGSNLGPSGPTGASVPGSTGTTGRGLEHSTSGHGSSGGVTSSERGLADTSHSIRESTGEHSGSGATHSDTTGARGRDDVQHGTQPKDPSLVETNTGGSGLKGEGVDGSHSAVFGLTPDGHVHQDTSHGQGKLQPAHTKSKVEGGTGDIGSRAPASSGVAEQLHDPKVAEKGHGGPAMSSSGSAKPGAGAPGGEQGFGEIRPQDHGAESKLKNKLDPTTDADNDGKRGIGD